MSDEFLQVVAQSARLAEQRFSHKSIAAVMARVFDAVKEGHEPQWRAAAQPQNLHLLAAVAGELREVIAEDDEPRADADKVEAVIQAIEDAVADKLVEVRKVKYTHANGWRIEFDCDEVVPDDPGAGTPAMVYTPRGSSATLYCAWEMGEVENEEVPPGLGAWLTQFLPLHEIVEMRTHPKYRH